MSCGHATYRRLRTSKSKFCVNATVCENERDEELEKTKRNTRENKLFACILFCIIDVNNLNV